MSDMLTTKIGINNRVRIKGTKVYIEYDDCNSTCIGTEIQEVEILEKGQLRQIIYPDNKWNCRIMIYGPARVEYGRFKVIIDLQSLEIQFITHYRPSSEFKQK